MRTGGIMARLARLEERLQPKGRRPIVVWWPNKPRPEVPNGAILLHVVREDQDQAD
jgi:glucose-6-phosphate dehydrogenase assembly protein OpcA